MQLLIFALDVKLIKFLCFYGLINIFLHLKISAADLSRHNLCMFRQ